MTTPKSQESESFEEVVQNAVINCDMSKVSIALTLAMLGTHQKPQLVSAKNYSEAKKFMDAILQAHQSAIREVVEKLKRDCGGYGGDSAYHEGPFYVVPLEYLDHLAELTSLEKGGGDDGR